jgi:hemolysin activation/secretion protein
MQTAGTPFFAMSTLAFTDVDRLGLGGLWSLRGYRQERFVGPVAALANLELRWTFVAFDVLSQHLALAVVPFLDLGRVFDRVGDASRKGWKPGSGGALHIAWNDATIINFTLGSSSEGTELYMDLGNQF